VPELPRDPLRDQLQATLGAAYTLTRELGGGGMSRVYVAHEAALGRDVVVKVLAPELSEGSAPSASRARSGSRRGCSRQTSSRCSRPA
jgi:serine/threonine protein kinase